MNPRIEITVAPDGGTHVETTGFASPACKAASKPYEDALGAKAAERLTPEYHATEPVVAEVGQRA